MEHAHPRTAVVLLLVIAVLSVNSSVAQDHVRLPIHRYFAFDAETRTVAVADLDLDGRLDMLSAGGGRIRVQYGDGLGGELDRLDLAVPSEEYGYIAVGDFDGNDRPDIAYVHETAAANARVFFNDGAGGYGDPVVLSVGNRPWWIVAGDFNEDGFDDLATANFADYSVSVILSTGDGGFSGRVPYHVGVGPSAVDAGDFDGDGHLDLAATVYWDDAVAILIGDGAGGFTVDRILTTDVEPKDVLAVDLDEDGLDDFVTTNYFGNSANVFMNQGGLVFARTEYTISRARTTASGDFDEDGNVDLVVTAAGLFLLRGDGEGGFVMDNPQQGAAGPKDCRAADMNGDGHLDIVARAYHYEGEGVSVFLGDGTGAFGEARTVDANLGPQSVALADFDEDGHDDAAIGGATGLWVFPGDGAGGFGEPTTIPGLRRIRSVVTADFDADGHEDLAAANSFDGSVHAFLGDGSGGFAESASLEEVFFEPWSLGVGSFNDRGDDHLDLVVVEYGARSVMVLEGDGAGGFSTGPRADVGDWPRSLTTADFDEDGHLDVAVGRLYQPGHVWIRFGDGNGVFPGVLELTDEWNSPTALAAGDLNEDGHQDLAVGRASRRAVSVRLGDGAGGFGPSTLYHVGVVPDRMIARDLDTDGDLDLAITNEMNRTVSILLGRGDGSLPADHHFGQPTEPTAFATSDLDGDGDLDLVMANEDDDRFTIALNRTRDPLHCRIGSVAAGLGRPEDVLFVNGFAGKGPERRVDVAPDTPFEIFMDAPSCDPDGPAKFALYAWLASPSEATVRVLPFGLGWTCLATWITDANPWKLKKTWNNIGKTGILGEPDLPSTPAPSVVLDKPGGVGLEATFFLQGVMLDCGATNGIASLTNGVEVVSAPIVR